MAETLTPAEMALLASLAPQARRRRRTHTPHSPASLASAALTELLIDATARGVSRADLAAATGMSVQAVGSRLAA